MYPAINKIATTKDATPIGIAISCLFTIYKITYVEDKNTAILFVLTPYFFFSL